MNFYLTSNPAFEDRQQWLDFVQNHPFGNSFQTPIIVDFYKSIPGYHPFSILIKDNTNQIKGVLVAVLQHEIGFIRRNFSSRMIIYGGPLVSENEPMYAAALLSELNRLSWKAIFIEFRNLFDLTMLKTCFNQAGFKFKEHLNYHVPILSEEENKKLLSKSKLRQIRTSIKAGAVIKLAESTDDIIELYKLLRNLYTTKVKKPLPPIQFFIEFFKRPELGVILIIERNDTIIGGMVCPVFNEKTIYEWYVCGLDGIEKDVYPSVLSTWAAIHFGIEKKLRLFDFLGAGSPDSDYGVREFKSKFGGNLVNYGRFHKINYKLLFLMGKTAIKFIGKLKN